MADITGRVQRNAAHLLAPDETVIAALLVEPRGTYGIAGAALAALPRTTSAALAARAAGDRASEGGLAARVPARPFVMAVTHRRVLLIPSNGLGMKELAAEFAPTDLALTGTTGRLLGRRLEFTFVDGSRVAVDAQRMQPLDAFAAAIGPAGGPEREPGT